MSYKQFDKNGNLVTPSDLQNKSLWCREGEKIEEAFVSKYGDDLNVGINPEKAINRYAPDLVFIPEDSFVDLKTQNTPFFKAKKLFGIDPSFAVVFNRKDYERYGEKYPGIDILFWVEWHSVRFEMGSFKQEVEYINGVWKISFKELAKLCETAPEHSYQQRRFDRLGNAKSSFVLDIRDSKFQKVI